WHAPRLVRPLRTIAARSRVVPAAVRRLGAGAEGRVDWTSTTAYAPSATCLGIRLNVVGRDARGLVPARRVDAVVDRLIGDLRAAELPEGGPFFSRVVSREDAVGELDDAPGLPDVFYEPATGIGVASEGRGTLVGAGRKRGEHRREGIIAIGGPLPGEMPR